MRQLSLRRHPPLIHHATLIALLVVVAASLNGCGDVSGTYQAEDKSDTIEFKGDRAYVTISPAPTIAGDYEIDGDKVIIRVNGQSMVFTHRDSTLDGGPFGMKFIKQ